MWMDSPAVILFFLTCQLLMSDVAPILSLLVDGLGEAAQAGLRVLVTH